MALTILVWQAEGQRFFACWKKERLIELAIEGEGAEDVGAIYLGRVSRVDRNLGAAFVDLGQGRSGMLPLREKMTLPTEGAALILQVQRPAVENKLMRLTDRPLLRGRLSELRGGTKIDLLARPGAKARPSEVFLAERDRLTANWAGLLTAAQAAKPPALLAPAPTRLVDLVLAQPASGGIAVAAATRNLADALTAELAQAGLAEIEVTYQPARDWQPSFADLAGEVAAALEPKVDFGEGAYLWIEQGRTLTAIDVNAGAALERKGQSGQNERGHLAINQAAAKEIARQLRLRNIGGLVAIDFIGLRQPAFRKQTVLALRQALAEDPARIRLLDMSELGLVEMTRQRRGASLADSLAKPCTTCAGEGRIALPLPPA